MLRPKKNSYKEFDNEKKFLRLENSPSPPPLPRITFLMVVLKTAHLITLSDEKSGTMLFKP